MSSQKNAPLKVGVKALEGSAQARKTASVVLESLCGLCSVEDASARLGIAVPRYYVLETRALQGLIEALEPRARGRQQTDESKLAALTRQTVRLERDVRRYQALHRAATRAIGVAPSAPKAAEAKGTKKRRVRRRARAERVVDALRGDVALDTGGDAAPQPAAKETS
ncbi:MAG: hypothetical protein IPK60_20570 [Sandaracinaceae bacterium]|nr:hypothetical protein [Sandaracinaceae bacterium]